MNLKIAAGTLLRPSSSLIILLFLVFAQGGIARFDILEPVLPRLFALLVVAHFMLSKDIFKIERVRWPFILIGCAAALLILQLIPLPPSIWTALPGRAAYSVATEAMGVGQVWRPWTLTPDRTWNALASLVIPAAFLYALGHFDGEARTRVLSILIMLVLASAIWGLLQLSTGDFSGFQIYSVVSIFSPGGAFANRNHQALFLAMGIPMLAILAFDRVPRTIGGSLWLWLCAGAAAFVALTIPTTGSRAGLIAGALGVLGATALSWISVKRALVRMPKRGRLVFLGAIVLALAAVLLLALLSPQSEAVRRLFAQDAAGDRRFQTLGPILQMVSSFFPFGSGFGSFDPVYRQFEPDAILSTFYVNQAHNEYLQVAAEGGLPGILLLGSALAWLSIRTAQVWSAPSGPAVRLARLGGLMIAMTLVGIIVDYPTRTPIFMMTVAIAAAWLESGARFGGKAQSGEGGPLPAPAPSL